MSATAQELENDIAQMEDRLANVKVVVEVEREAWRRSSHTGKTGTKWKGAATSRNKEKDSTTSSTTTANSSPNDDVGEDITIMPGYWDALELAQYLRTKQLGSYAQVVVGEQITGKMLLDTPAPKLRKLFDGVDVPTNCWKALQDEYVKLKKHQRRLEKAVATNRSQPGSSRSLDSALETSDQPSPSTVMSSAGAALVFPLISPRPPATLGTNTLGQTCQQNAAKPPVASKAVFPLRKPASSNSIPMVTCWNCKTRFLRPYTRRPVAGASNANTSQPVSSSMRASLVARAYCSRTCQESIESSDIRISPSLSARVKVTFDPSNASAEDTIKRNRLSRVATGLASILTSSSDQLDPGLLIHSDSIAVNQLGGNADVKDGRTPPPRAKKRLRKFKTFVRRPSRPDASLDNPSNFDFLHVAAPKREGVISTVTSPRHDSTEGHSFYDVAGGNHTNFRLSDANASTTFTICPSVTSLAINSYRPTGTVCASPEKPVPPALILKNSSSQGASKQSRVFQQCKYKLDPEIYQAHPETFSSCFGAIPTSNRASREVEYGRKNLLRLQEFITVRALHRLSLTSRAWFDMITFSSVFSDALWGVHVLRIWRPSEEDEDFLRSIDVLQKPERPRRMLQILTRQVSRVTIENMKVLLNPESWQLATVMAPQDGESMLSLQKLMTRKRDRLVACNRGELLPRRQSADEMYEQITAIYTRAGDIVAICTKQLIRPVDPTALLTDVLQGLRSGELLSVHCRRLRLFSQANRLHFDQYALLSHCSRTVVEFFWSDSGTECAVLPLGPPVWHQKILNKLQHALQQRLLGKDSVNSLIKAAQDQNTPPAMLLLLEKFLARCHTQ